MGEVLSSKVGTGEIAISPSALETGTVLDELFAVGSGKISRFESLQCGHVHSLDLDIELK